MTDDAIASAIGARLQELRLKKNLSQEQVAEEAGISRQTLINLLHGKGTMVNLVAVLRAIGELERVTSLIQPVRPSPIQVIKMAGTQRVRATGARSARQDGKVSAGSKVISSSRVGVHKKGVDW
ncbi:helix-turn-helix transcriptional regulator [Pseudomonas baetica]|jgi:transcriptional regulator with XRE-family HTH domain|uniref:helix-turn-helix transcriptional regulator n=1 Tax=Pseudomonas baetica TaxID=674054 RepID=UPI002406F4CE|nr:helix-turn-helix transcriptional regulator [Pseudomonas baetica]MDF9778784.1 transcriptional regulator with XRE-family HTH domain [Pseudomonas baetica]